MTAKHKLKKTKQRPPQAVAERPRVARLQDAQRELRRGSLAPASRLAEHVLQSAQAAGDTTMAEAARRLLAEARFRAAAGAARPDERLSLLEEALEYAPGLAKLRFWRALAFWQLGRLPDALADLEAVYAVEPERRGLAFLLQLAQLATGQPVVARAMSPAEANTLRVVDAVLQGAQAAAATVPAPPLMGKGDVLWQALLAMRGDAASAPLEMLRQAIEQNGRQPVARILRYFLGVAAMRAGERGRAYEALMAAQAAGLDTPRCQQNLVALLQELALEAAGDGRWQDIVARAGRQPLYKHDRVLAETLGLAHSHLGHAKALAGRWTDATLHWRAAYELTPSRQLAQNLALAEEALGNWEGAAEAWREMVRRRSRKAGGTDYLSDDQVAALWDHIAECYRRAGRDDQAVTTLRRAAHYAPDSVDQRMKLVDALVGDERENAAINELERILESEPQHEEALMRLAALYRDRWNEDPMPLWRRVLAINPANSDARDELANAYLAMVGNYGDDSAPPRFPFGIRLEPRARSNQLQQALKDVPGHPRLLVALGYAYLDMRKPDEAREVLLEAIRTAPGDVHVAADVLHELLHAAAGDEVERLLPQVRQIRNLLPAFWIDMGSGVLSCKLGEDWARRFFDEAIALCGQPWTEETRASVALRIRAEAQELEATAIADEFAQLAQVEAPASGAADYLEARRLVDEGDDKRNVLRVLKKAERAARAARDQGMITLIEELEEEIRSPKLARGLLDILRDLR